MLYILQARLQAFLTHQIAPEQAGFVKGRGTREQILNARQLIEKAREYSGRPEGKRKRGRSPTWWTDVISKLTETNIATAARQANDRRRQEGNGQKNN
ncbi:hypothetical protein ILUMI_24921 [Ignelater luminosus]|uniref:Reverse transcriptase domain-containing protein n=1 Tax=Ignelater luminosus TaxID=2038154 RepID=A0A8K0C893_IGNLU|nr:hypothetical protein ILUMI_24921 [Ignelater luminosus]